MKRANLGLIRDHFRLEFGLAFGMVFEWGGGGISGNEIGCVRICIRSVPVVCVN